MRRRRHSFNIFFPKARAHLSHQIKQRTHENFYTFFYLKTLYRIDIFDIVPIQTVGELKSCRKIF